MMIATPVMSSILPRNCRNDPSGLNINSMFHSLFSPDGDGEAGPSPPEIPNGTLCSLQDISFCFQGLTPTGLTLSEEEMQTLCALAVEVLQPIYFAESRKKSASDTSIGLEPSTALVKQLLSEFVTFRHLVAQLKWQLDRKYIPLEQICQQGAWKVDSDTSESHVDSGEQISRESIHRLCTLIFEMYCRLCAR